MTCIESILKKMLIVVICLTCVASVILSTIPLAESKGSSGILGTNAALGSPVLNNNFTVDSWNKWEMICWGVFLSNFCVPLVDDYESCFMTGKGGSNGTGYKALCFGTGNDKTNNDTIESLTTYAAVQQNVTKKQVYVSYSEISGGLYKDSTEFDPNAVQTSSGDLLRPATFKDFFFDTKKDSSKSVGNTWANAGKKNFSTIVTETSYNGYTNIGSIGSALIPTFWIKNGSNKFVKVYDYRDSWDVQMTEAMLNAVRPLSTRTQDDNQFAKAFNSFWSADTLVYMDSFGNLTVDGKMLIPAAVNKHITRDETINLMNSWVLNGYSSTYDNRQLTLGLKQDVQSLLGKWDNVWNRRGGYPAFGQSNIGGVGLLYYDTDTIMINKMLKGNIDIKYGDVLATLYDTDITSTKTDYNLKFEISDRFAEDTSIGIFTFLNDPDIPDNTRFAASMLSNINTNGTAGKEILDYIVDMYGNKIDLYNKNGVVSAVQVNTAKLSDKDKTAAARMYYQFLYEVWSGQKTNSSLTQNALKSVLSSYGWSEFWYKIHEVNAGLIPNGDGDWWAAFVKAYPEFKKIKGVSQSDWIDANDNDSVSKNATRIVKIYPVSNEMKAVAQVFAVVDGYEFAQYSTMIYMTYLDWYGISTNTSLTGAQTKSSGFNPDIFDGTSDVEKAAIDQIIETTSEDEMEREVIHLGFLMLHPEQGRSYRQQLVQTTFQDIIYEWYNRAVYGGAGDYKGSTSKSNSGFLNINPYSENFLTAPILEKYVDIAVYLIMGLLIVIIIVGLLKSMKLSWYFISILVMINTVLIVPSLGDIVPYVTSNCIQNMFSNKMTFWSISQGVSNAGLESQQSDYTKGLTAEESATVNSMIKQLSVIYTDRSLMVKQDISQKVTQITVGSYSDIQSLQSARWVLPMVMQQFNSDDNNGQKYIYKTLSNIWDDLSNMYWYYDPEDATATNTESKTLTSEQGGDSVPSMNPADKYSILESYHEEVDKDKNIFDTEVNYHCYSYTLNGNVGDQVHLSMYYLPDSKRAAFESTSVLGEHNENYKNADSWQGYIDMVKNRANGSNWATNKISNNEILDIDDGFEYTADSYDRTQRSSITSDMPYLLSTENPIYYFYSVIKDSFDSTMNVGALIGQLQGQIELDANGEPARSNFMYATVGDEAVPSNKLEYTNYTRDVLDLEEMFKNMIPYMYKMQLTAGGFDGISGVLGDSEITDELQYYEGNKQSWLYRCNWATKIIENPDYSKGGIIGDGSGNKIKISNLSMPNSYTVDGGREMVFSEAQMYAMGLTESDLSIVELKCVETNREVAKQWTMLINYAGTDGLTKEVLMRQMATDATLIFCNEFSSTGFLNTMYTMYPQSLDLRHLSFDSIMKMLILNVSKNTSYIYGDTMLTLIEDSHILTALILLLDAILCSEIMPLVREILMALIFYMTFFSMIRTIVGSSSYRMRVAGGTLITNIIVSVGTIIYYWLFSTLMRINASDEILTVDSVQVSVGSPIWVLLLVIIISAVYVYAMLWMCRFVLQNARDMGFEAYSAIASDTVSHISDALGGIGNNIVNFFGGDEHITTNTHNKMVDSRTTNTDNTTNVSVGKGGNSGGAGGTGVARAGSVAGIPSDMQMPNGTGDQLANSDGYVDKQLLAGNVYNEEEAERQRAASIDQEIDKGERKAKEDRAEKIELNLEKKE